MTVCAIIDNGGANIASLQFALQRLGVESAVSAEADVVRRASHVILPGVGAAADAMQRLRGSGLDRIIATLEQPVLGICLGMQLLFDGSAEGPADCLGIIPGRAVRFTEAPGRPVPHIGWNTVEPAGTSPLLHGIENDAYAYFVHSYRLPPGDATIATTHYGETFASCVAWRNFFGAQFHPERSAAVGARVLQNFLSIES